ncbi:hypothetical protein X992_5495 [Burkholderia pseudomallei MSHR5492]|nr:hypothetical protein X992_5495 [Burkholderia pseudomallei MSHR5492]
MYVFGDLAAPRRPPDFRWDAYLRWLAVMFACRTIQVVAEHRCKLDASAFCSNAATQFERCIACDDVACAPSNTSCRRFPSRSHDVFPSLLRSTPFIHSGEEFFIRERFC